MKKEIIILLSIMCVFTLTRQCAGMQESLASRKFSKLALVMYDVPSDCHAYIDEEKTLEHMKEFLAARLGPFARIVQSAQAPHLAVQADCMRLVDVRGQGRTVGYAINILVQFYRPFYEDITYVHAAPWTRSFLIYFSAETFTQMDFEQQLDFALIEFSDLWLDEHRSSTKTDYKR